MLILQLCPTLCDPLDCSPLGSSVHGILQARILEWVAISFSRGSSQPRDQTLVSWIAGRFFTIWTTREALRVVQWLSIHLPVQGTQVQFLVWKDPTYHVTTKPVHHNSWAWALKLLKPKCPRAGAPQQESSPYLLQQEKACIHQWRPVQPKMNK